MAAPRHDVDRTVRNYLLEFADAGEMVSFEDRYITDPEFLKLVEVEEERLIEDYLLGRLEPAFRKRFELISERNSAWAPKIDLVQQRLRVAAIKPLRQNRFWTVTFATCASVACVALIAFFLLQRSYPKPTEAKLEIPADQPFFGIRLSPGVSKGISQTPPTVPSGNNRLRFILDMPGIKGPISCRVRLLRIEADGNRREIAVSPLSLSSPGPSSEATIVFDQQLLPSGDFLAELIDQNGTILERYVFRAM